MRFWFRISEGQDSSLVNEKLFETVLFVRSLIIEYVVVPEGVCKRRVLLNTDKPTELETVVSSAFTMPNISKAIIKIIIYIFFMFPPRDYQFLHLLKCQ